MSWSDYAALIALSLYMLMTFGGAYFVMLMVYRALKLMWKSRGE